MGVTGQLEIKKPARPCRHVGLMFEKEGEEVVRYGGKQGDFVRFDSNRGIIDPGNVDDPAVWSLPGCAPP